MKSIKFQTTEVSEPGSAIRVFKLELSEEGRKALSIGNANFPRYQPTFFERVKWFFQAFRNKRDQGS